MSTKLKRIMFTPDEDTLPIMEELEGKGRNKSDAINRAMKVEKALRETASDGGTVYIKKPNGDHVEVVLIG